MGRLHHRLVFSIGILAGAVAGGVWGLLRGTEVADVVWSSFLGAAVGWVLSLLVGSLVLRK